MSIYFSAFFFKLVSKLNFFLIIFKAKKSVDEFHKAGGTEKLKQVARSDLNEGTKLAKEMITYDIPNLIKKIWSDLKRK